MSRTAAWCEVQDLLRGVAAHDVERVLREALEDEVYKRRGLEEEIEDRPSLDRYNEVRKERDDAVWEQERAEAKLEQAEERADEEKKRADAADAENAKLRQEVADLQEAVRNLVAADGAAVAPAAGSSTATTTRGAADEADADRAPDTARTPRAVVSLDAWRSKVGYGAKVPIATRGEAAKAGAATVVRGVVFGNNKRRAYDRYVAAGELDESAPTMAKAERLYREAIALDPDLAIAYTNLGNVRYRQGDPSEAMALYEEAMRIDPRQPDAAYNLGYLKHEIGDYDGGIRLYKLALDLDPKFSHAWFNLGEALRERGRLNESIAAYRKFLEVESGGDWANLARQQIEGMGGRVESKRTRASSRRTGGAPAR